MLKIIIFGSQYAISTLLEWLPFTKRSVLDLHLLPQMDLKVAVPGRTSADPADPGGLPQIDVTGLMLE